MGKKKKRNKVTYIDDGSTIADMSALGARSGKDGMKLPSSLSDRTKTFFGAMKMMIGPMFVAITIIGVTFLIGWLLLFLFS